MSAIRVPTTTRRVPAGRSIVSPPTSRPFSASARSESRPLTVERTDHCAPEARHASDHEHRQRDEREIEIHRLCVDRQEVHVEPAREPCEHAGEREGDEPLPVHRDADGSRGRGVLPGGAEEATVTARLVAECNPDHEQCSERGLQQVGRLGYRREHVRPGSDLLVVPQEVVRDLEHPEGGDARCQTREAHRGEDRREAHRGRRSPLRGRARGCCRSCGRGETGTGTA